MELKLTYDGLLLVASGSNTRAQHKHDIRRAFHPQLRRFWQTHAVLKQARAKQFMAGEGTHTERSVKCACFATHIVFQQQK